MLSKKYGFEFSYERLRIEKWWYFRPFGHALWAKHICSLTTTKRDFEEGLLKVSESARRLYKDYLARVSDVEAAEERLAQARKEYEQCLFPDFDLTDLTSPGVADRVIRKLKQEQELQRADDAVKLGKYYREVLKAGNRA